jgi:hypothetical protein
MHPNYFIRHSLKVPRKETATQADRLQQLTDRAIYDEQCDP